MRSIRRLPLLLLLALAPLELVAQYDFVSIDPSWQKGDRRSYEVTKSREDTKPGAPPKRSSVTYPLTVEVVSTSDDGHRVAWTTGKMRMGDGTSGGAEAAPESIQKMLEGIRLVVALDESYSVTGLANLTVVREQMLKVVDDMIAMMDDGSTKASRESLEQLRATFAREGVIEAAFLREPQAYFLPIGSTVIAGEPNETHQLLPNPLGGEPFPVVATLSLEGVDTTTSIATVRSTTVFEPEAAGRIIRAFLMKLMGDEAAKIPQEELFKQFNIEDELVTRVDLKTGWVVDMTHTRTAMIQGNSRVETLAIRPAGE